MTEEQLTTNEMIRRAQLILGVTALNRDIKRFCKSNYGVEPISQQIYGVLGAEFERLSAAYSARQLVQTKKHIKLNFDGNFDLAYGAMRLVGQI
jgi:hypothetical protein